MKILHVGKYYYPYAGGMESVVKDICEGLAEKGHDVTVLCSHEQASTQEEIINGVRIIRLPRTGVVFGQNINPTMAIKLQEIAASFDLIHFHCPNPQAEFLALTLPKSIPMVATYHSDIVRQKTLLKAYAPIFKRFLGRMQKIYVPTENHITFSCFLPDFEKKCELIPFGIRDEFLKSSDENLKCAQNYRKEFGPYALFVGRLVGYKGVDVLIEAAKNFNQKVIIVGGGPEFDHLNNKVKSLSLEDQVKILGKVMEMEKFVGLYLGCEMLVLPSVTPNENFGVVQLEAMACSKPVVTTDLKSGVPAVGVKNETCLIVEPGNSDQLAKAMHLIFNNQELKQKLGNAGRERFEKIYTWKQMITSHVESYRKALEIQEIINKHGNDNAA